MQSSQHAPCSRMNVIFLDKIGVDAFASEDFTPIHFGEGASFVTVLVGSERQDAFDPLSLNLHLENPTENKDGDRRAWLRRHQKIADRFGLISLPRTTEATLNQRLLHRNARPSNCPPRPVRGRKTTGYQVACYQVF